MYINVQIAYYMIGVLLILMTIFIMATLSLKWNKKRVEKRRAQCLVRHKDYLDYVQMHLGEEDRLRTPGGSLTTFERRVLQSELVQWINRLDGVYRHRLLRLCGDLGLVEHNLKRLGSHRPLVRLDAAYHLGALRAPEATSSLLSLLYKKRVDSSSFIYARAAAQTATQLSEMGDLLRFLIENGKQDVHLTADITRESELDLTQLFITFLHEKNPKYVKLGLIGLQNSVKADLPDRIQELTKSDDRDIRMNAAKLLISSVDLSEEDVQFYLAFPDWEVRRLFAEWIGRSGLIQYIPLLSTRMEDVNWMVARASAASLVRMGDEGFEALCQLAVGNGSEHGRALAREFIEEDLKQSAAASSHVEDIMSHNHKEFLYKKYFENHQTLTNVM
ncbi:hypothetical protein JF544_11710 [Halobacillus kuroshimensis]|uniref:HEAT repeat domain-containing protein n=1 Tax=Halobacillus kuroshimensis TaxID=302481 RepID=A0ABS3DX70_9BACI|nr:MULTISPECIES: hypothetical protein [Halobacillus]MBN8235921.1 hypothetical protein [Halobacillus kuroshimensis]